MSSVALIFCFISLLTYTYTSSKAFGLEPSKTVFSLTSLLVSMPVLAAAVAEALACGTDDDALGDGDASLELQADNTVPIANKDARLNVANFFVFAMFVFSPYK
jgi:hypothetical protein